MSAFGAAHQLRILLSGTAPDDSEEEGDNSDYQQNADESANSGGSDPTQQPQKEHYNTNCKKHGNYPLNTFDRVSDRRLGVSGS